ncbi:MBL fold metallo-hydrolase [Sphingorhabdus sp. YGSMI21]|uniref:MBL fold metallo-hydrolase n=1 Tax=Sphingorhabdus sp. YGSMI21 TaxID=2077182 RepID=UPI000C1F6263|nr:MBL fold metallo-hydrolase [Sphingorhabdus sp. YGSMI21]ATW04726.1 hypothetical protein CHN51_15160 [Sphingorhabdus sp. YGSMI21]
MRLMQIMLASAVALAAIPAHAQEQSNAPSEATKQTDAGLWVTLGTRGGPVASPTRSQPSNLLVAGGKNYLVDVGDGSAGQLAKKGLQTTMLEGVFISHLHFDHTGGLAAILGLRFQTNPKNKLKVFGPPGTKEMIDGLIMSMNPGATANYGVEGAPAANPRDQVEVVELRDTNKVALEGMNVSVRKNSHYSFKPGGEMARRFEALSYRFDLPGRSIVYTGDTGPSKAVEELAKDADLLVAEMMDVEMMIGLVRLANPNMPDNIAKGMEAHMTKHHLLPKDVGEMAARAGVKAVVVTHFAGIEPNNPGHMPYLGTIAEHYNGPVVIANDMDEY